MPYCSKCGTQIEEGTTFCSSCGQAVGSQMQDGSFSSQGNVGASNLIAKRSLRWGPIFLGAFICMLVMFITGLIIGFAVPDISENALLLATIIIALVCYMIGGLIAGAMAGYKGATHGMLAALIAWVVNLIISVALGGF